MNIRGYQFKDCRGLLRHAWHEVDSPWFEGWSGHNDLTPFTIRCERCDTERRDTVDQHGELYSRRYVYPSGYAIHVRDGEERPVISDWRMEWLELQSKRRKARKRA